MLPLINKFRLNASILSIGQTGGASGGNTLILDSNYHLYEMQNGGFIFSKKIFDFTPQHQFSKACAVSMFGYVAIGKPKSNECEILHLRNGKLTPITKLAWHKADIYNIRFSRDGKYLVTGGEDGKVFVFSLPNFKIASILPPRPDYISNVHFSKTNSLVVYSSYDMINCVFDMKRNIEIGFFETNSVVEDIVFFDNDTKIFFICSNGESGIYNVESKELAVKQNYNSWLTRVGLSKDDNYAYIGMRDKTLSYLNLSTNSPQFNVELEYNDGIVAMRVINAKLHIGYSNGYLQIFDLAKHESEFEDALKKGNLKLANEIANQNISLKTHKLYSESMDKLWRREFSKAQAILTQDETKVKSIQTTLSIFFDDRVKKEQFNAFVASLGILGEFMEAMGEKDYAKAYKIADENEAIKDSDEYEKLEAIFNAIFGEAQKLLEEEGSAVSNRVSEMLKPFAQVQCKKDIVSALIKNADKFLQADKFLKAKHYAEYFKLAESLKALKETLGYKKAMLVGEQILATINSLILSGNFNKASELIELLIKLTPFHKIAQELKENLKLRIEFLELFGKNDYTKIFNSLEKYESLKGIPEYVALQNNTDTTFDNALALAHKGDTIAVHTELTTYLNTPFWESRVENIFNISYLNEIRNAMEANASVDWKGTLEKYIASFGKNDEIVNICSKNPKIKGILDLVENKEAKPQILQSIIVAAS